MLDTERLVEYADQLVEACCTEPALSQVHRLVLMAVLATDKKTKTYGQIATEAGYSSGYVKLVAAELWKLLSKAVGTKVTKGNVQTILQRQLESESFETLPQTVSTTEEDALVSEPSLTITPQNLQAPTPEVKAEEVKEAEEQAGRAVILVVDDQPHNVSLLTNVMEQDDYEVWQATSGTEALHMATELLPDLILLDVNMPDMDGYTVCRQLKAEQQTAGIPIIFVSALNESWDKVQGFSVGGSDYITKPFNTMEVIIRIENQLEIRRRQDQGLIAAQARTAASYEETVVSESTQPSSKVVILVVDDNPKNLTLLTDVLENDGYEVWQADSGLEGIRIAGTVLPDLILLDINMPDMKGYNVCQQLKADAKTKRIPVIFISALDDTWDKLEAFSVGGSDYVNKPIQIVELMARIKHQLQIWQ